MAKDSDRLRGGFQAEESSGLSGLLAEEDEFDRRTLWRLGTWAALSVGAVILAVVTNQSTIGLRREQSASAGLIKQAQQIQLSARESQNETRRLASAVDTLNSDRDRLYSRVAVLEQGLDSVTGAIARQAPASSPQASAGPTGTSQQANASAAPAASPSAPSQASAPSPAPASTASTAPVVAASVDPPPAAAKPTPAAPVVAPVAAIVPATADKQDKAADKQDKVADKKDKVADKKDKQASQASMAAPSEPSPTPAAKSVAALPSAPAEPSGSLMASKSMMAPPDPAAGKLIEPVKPPKTVTSAPMPEIAAVAPKASEETESDLAPAVVPAPTLQRTEFGVDVGGANSVPGLRALWRGLLRSKSNAALTKLRPIIVIKENNNGLGMQLRVVAGPISDAAAAAKICASLTVNDRGCSTTVFEGQRLVVSADEQAKTDIKTASETKPEPESKSDSAQKGSFHRRYAAKHPPKEEDPPPKPEPSTLSLIFGKH